MMKKNFINFALGSILIGGILFPLGASATKMETYTEETITIKDEASFKPLSDDTIVISDSDGSSSFDGGGANNPSGGYTWNRSDDNGRFQFRLPKRYSSISINNNISINGRYDEYYSNIGVFFPIPGNVLSNSAETFRLNGTVNQNQTVKIGEGTVTVILDTWGSDNYGHMEAEWYMRLEDQTLSIWTPSQEFSAGWGDGEPTWLIDQMVPYPVLEVPAEYHDKIGNGAPYMHWYDNAYPRYTENPELILHGTI